MIPDTNNPKILIVDDKPENILAMEKILKPLNLTLFKANSGNEALQLILEEEFVTILLDVQMPGMSGFEAAKLIHENKTIQTVPIIFVTAFDRDEEHIYQGHEAGAVDYLFKPIEPDILLPKIRIFIELFKQKQELRHLLKELQNTQESLKETNQKLEYLAHHDPTTHLPNRLDFERTLKKAFAQAERHQRKFALLLVDLNKFKEVNDRFGHLVGDKVLAAAADRILLSLRVDDDVIHLDKSENFISRLGGDEFCIVLNEIKAFEDAEIVAKRLLKSFELPFKLDGEEIYLGASIGIACYPDSALEMLTLIKSADDAMYAAKKLGSNHYSVASTFCDDKMRKVP